MICPKCKREKTEQTGKGTIKCIDWLCNWESRVHYQKEIQDRSTRDVRRTTASR